VHSYLSKMQKCKENVEDETFEIYTKSVILIPIDAPDQSTGVRLDVWLLKGIESRTALQIRNDPCTRFFHLPNTNLKIKLYNSWMRRSLLLAFVQTLVTQRLCFSERNVSFAELMHAFEYEGGLHLFYPLLSKHAGSCGTDIAMGPTPRPGIANKKRKKSTESSLLPIFASAACALANWHRLQHGLDYNFKKARSGSIQYSSFVCKPPSFECSSTRFALRILNSPDKIAETGTDPTFELATRKPQWLSCILESISVLRNELVESNVHASHDYSSMAFTHLQRKVDTDPCGAFLSVLADTSRCCAKSVFATGKAHNPVQFAAEVISHVLSYGNIHSPSSGSASASSASSASSAPASAASSAAASSSNHSHSAEAVMNTQVKFSRATVQLALKIMKSMPRIGSLLSLSNHVHGFQSQSLERKLFEEELLKHDLKVISWNETSSSSFMQPLMFPPCLRNLTTNSSPHKVGTPIVLLELVQNELQ